MASKAPKTTLLPTAEQLRSVALYSLGGLVTGEPIGRHSGHPDRVDSAGLTKREVLYAAINRDTSFFHGMVKRLRQGDLPPSQRRWRKKQSGGFRPIDDGSEAKRLSSLHIKHLIEPGVEQLLADDQYGGRHARHVPRHCQHPSAGPIDHLASRAYQLVQAGYTWCLEVDLKDAFGQVPLKLIMNQLGHRSLKLARQDRLHILRHVRIDAVDDRGVHHRRPSRGIEQGNPLSALLMNLALAPVLRHLESELDVRALAYIDDIYVLCRSEEDAKKTFEAFSRTATELGIKGVRGLGHSGKASRITNIEEAPVTLLKTYTLSRSSLGLTEEKATELRDELEQREPQTRGCFDHVQKVARAWALSRAWAKANGFLIPMRIPQNDTEVCEDLSSPHTSTSDITRMGEQETALLDTQHLPPQGEEAQRSISVPPLDAPTVDTTNVGHLTHNEKESYLPPHAPQARVRPSDDTHPHRGSDNHKVLDDQHARATAVTPASAGAGASRAVTRARTRYPMPGQGASCKDCKVEQGAPVRILQDTEVVDRLRNGRRLRVGDRYKGCILDLRGLCGVLGVGHDSDDLRGELRQLLKAGRRLRKVHVLVTPRDRWTTRADLLGRRHDPQYVEVGRADHDDGVVVELLLRQARRPSPARTAPPPDEATMIVRRVSPSLHHPTAWVITTERDGRRSRRRVRVDLPGSAGAPVQALARGVQQTDGTIAVPARRQLVRLLTDVDGQPPDAPRDTILHDAAVSLRGSHRWSIAGNGDWLLGRRF